MVAKMLLLAASASVALASASARTLSQENGAAFADAVQISQSGPAENYAEGETEADTFGPNDTAFADAQGFAGYGYYGYVPGTDELQPGDQYFASAKTVANTFTDNLDGLSDVPDSQSFASSDADAATEKSAAQAEAYSEAEATLGSAYARADAEADSFLFSGAETRAEAYGRNNAKAEAGSNAFAAEYTSVEAEADAVAELGDATAIATALAVDIEGFGDDGDAFASSTTNALAERGGTADASSFSGALSGEEGLAEAQATAISEAAYGLRAGVATSRSRSRASESLP